MRKLRRTALSLVLAVALLAVFAVPVAAGNPQVSITVSAQVVSITNSQPTWTMGTITTGTTLYFSANNEQNNTYSRVTNTGNVAVNVAIQGANFVASSNTTFNWALNTTAGDQAFSLHANTNGGETYNIELVTEGHPYLVEDLDHTESNTHDWSMKFVGPTAFHEDDDGLVKDATVTLVASKA